MSTNIYPKATSPATWAALEAANARSDRWKQRCDEARARRESLVERVKALADEWWRYSSEAHPDPTWRGVCHDLRVLLDEEGKP